MDNAMIIDIKASNDDEVSVTIKLSKTTCKVLNNSPKILQVPIWI